MNDTAPGARLEDLADPAYWALLDDIRRTHPAYDPEIRNGAYVAPDVTYVPGVLPGFACVVDELWPE